MKLLKSLVLFFGLLSISTFATNAYFSDQASVSSNSFSSGTWHIEPPSSARVVINEVYYDPAGTDADKEWTEIYNAGGQPVNLTNYQLGASSSNYTFPDTTLNPQSFIIVHWNADGSNSATDLYAGNGFNNMGNTNGSVALFNSTTKNSSTIIDYLEYGSAGRTWESVATSAGIWTAGDHTLNVAKGHSLERSPVGGDTNTAADFTDRAVPTPGA